MDPIEEWPYWGNKQDATGVNRQPAFRFLEPPDGVEVAEGKALRIY
ncbi:MAG: hypothetical protein ABJA82_01650 [Myxococcales bacterium]